MLDGLIDLIDLPVTKSRSNTTISGIVIRHDLNITNKWSIITFRPTLIKQVRYALFNMYIKYMAPNLNLNQYFSILM